MYCVTADLPLFLFWFCFFPGQIAKNENIYIYIYIFDTKKVEIGFVLNTKLIFF